MRIGVSLAYLSDLRICFNPGYRIIGPNGPFQRSEPGVAGMAPVQRRGEGSGGNPRRLRV